MLLEFTNYFKDNNKFSINMLEIEYIEPYGIDGAKVLMKSSSKAHFVKGNLTEITDYINRHNIKYEAKITLFNKNSSFD
jgi:hypothetical protein